MKTIWILEFPAEVAADKRAQKQRANWAGTRERGSCCQRRGGGGESTKAAVAPAVWTQCQMGVMQISSDLFTNNSNHTAIRLSHKAES